MKKVYNYIILFVLAFVAVSCSEDETNTIPAQSGDDVQFTLSLDNSSRTIYGPEDETNGAFPIYWINGDKVQIFSPDCLEGRRSAEYEVTAASATQNFADKLSKTGDYGVQWGDAETADFYSLYPSGNYSLSSDGSKAENIVINYSQNVLVDGESVKSDMEDCLMYARTIGVKKGEVVSLQYNPISTVFMITLNVSENSLDDFTIQSVSLSAPDGTNIAGTFSLDIESGTFAEWGDNKSNTISAQIYDKSTGGYYTLVKGNSVEIPLFIAPVEGLNTNGWKIEIVANSTKYVKTLGSEDSYKEVVAGNIHKIKLPALSIEATETVWDVSKWMTYIPRNVYLSEISIPGTWNSLNPDFQNVTNIKQQYDKGVRAFHIDTRWKRTGYSWIIGNNYEYTLGTADGGDTSVGGSDKYMTSSSNPTFEETLNTIIGNVASDEYMIVVCSFAQNSANYKSNIGYWYDEISAICNKYDLVYDARNITANTVVGDVLGSVIVIVNMPELISDTTTLPTNSKCFFTYLPSELTAEHFDSNFKDNSDKLWLAKTTTTDETTITVAVDSEISIFNNQAQITSATESGISTNNRGYAPTSDERTTILNYILEWSENNYGKEDYAHNQWMYLGLGGYYINTNYNPEPVSGSYVTIETEYNSWINDKVEAMGKNGAPYYPVGIVLMNNKNGDTDYSGKTNAEGQAYNFAAVVKNILLLNNKYRLQYDPSKPSDYDPNYKDPDDSDNSGNEGGDIIF